MAEKKYKVTDLAKDFGKQNKEIIELLAEGSDEPKKKATTALEAKDLDLFFNRIAMKNQVENCDKYFALAEEAVKKEEKVEKKAEEKSAPKAENKKAEKKAVSEKAAPAPQQKKKEKQDKPMQSRTKGEARTINTRAEEVELDKYNERYENIAPADRHR